MIHIQLQKFEGPLALLLHLIRKEEMDILDINIHEITKQYLEYIKRMKELDLELAGDFVAMASTLIQIKARMLLPSYNEEGEVVEEEDPRRELVQRLLEYEKYQEAATALYDRPLLGRDIWLRGHREDLPKPEEGIEVEDNALFALISSYRKALRSMKKKVHKVASKAQSIASRILEIKDKLILGQQVKMSSLINSQESENRLKERLITFLSLLELGKLQMVKLFQSDVYEEIYVEGCQQIDNDAVSRVEEYETDSEAEAERILNNSQAQASFEEEDMASDEEMALEERKLGLNEVPV